MAGQQDTQDRLVTVGAALVPLVAAATISAFRGQLENTNAALVLVLIIVASASTGIRSAGILAALSSAVWFDFFLTVPYNRLTIADREDIETTILLVVIGAAVTEIALWGRRQQARASRQSGYLAGVMTTSQAVARGGSTDDVIDQVRAELTAVLGIDGCRFVVNGKRPDEAQLNADGSVTRGGHEYKVERDGLPTDSEIELVVQHAGMVRGRFLLTAATRIARPDLEQRLVAVALADQVGAALASQETAQNHT
jgi:K+-sensing histidine kinase KdpD